MVGKKIDYSEIPSFTWVAPKIQIDLINSHLKRLLGVETYRLAPVASVPILPIFDLPRRSIQEISSDHQSRHRLTPVDAVEALSFIFSKDVPSHYRFSDTFVDFVGAITFTNSGPVEVEKETATRRKKNARLLRQGNKGSKNSRGRNWWESR